MNDEIITQESAEPENETVFEEEVTEEPAESQANLSTEENADLSKDEKEADDDGEIGEVEFLRKELDALRSELEEKNKVFERMSREIGEFSELFPEKSVNNVPDNVWESVKAGIPLAAAYALYERKNTVRADAASRINERNGEKTTGAIGRTSTENFYTPDEVKSMSRAEVRRNYSKIIESMKKWN